MTTQHTHSQNLSQRKLVILSVDNLTKQAGLGGLSIMYDIVPVSCPDSGMKSYWKKIPIIPNFVNIAYSTNILN